MKIEDFISLEQLCTHYQVEISFINNLVEIGLIKIEPIEQTYYVHIDQITQLEKMIRMHHDLEVNIAGIDVAINLLQKIEALQTEMLMLKNRLRLYEDEGL